MSPRWAKSAVDEIVLSQLGGVVQFFAAEVVGEEVAVEIRCSKCAKVFHLCRPCFRGHVYCSEECRREARILALRVVRLRHALSVEGREDNRDCNRAYRQRRRARVMDQRSQKLDSAMKSAVKAIPAAQHLARRRGFVVCAVCGAERRLIVVRPRRRRARDPP